MKKKITEISKFIFKTFKFEPKGNKINNGKYDLKTN